MTDQLSKLKLNCGDVVRERGGRHLGEVVRVDRANARVLYATVKWQGTNWRTNVFADEIEVVMPARYVEASRFVPCRPRTMAESPRAKLEAYIAERRGA